MNDINRTLEQFVTSNPKSANVFVHYGLDFCCRGRRPLDQACAEAGVDLEAVSADLARIAAEGAPEETVADRPLPELIDHILTRYHEPLRRDLPALLALARKVEARHADKASCPAGLAEHLEQVQESIESHLAKEENILFPMILAGGSGAAVFMPIKVMMQEHEDHGENLRQTRALAHDFVAPPEACASWRALYAGLAALETDLFSHVHLENYVLFPRASGARDGANP